jgi:hypothetical protein
MGTIKQGILGGFSGKVGSVVGTSWKGIAVMKAMPLSVANPKTSKQITQRNSFSDVVKLAGSILATIIKPLWDRFASGQSGYNAFVSNNIGAVNGGQVFEGNGFAISKGKMAGTPITAGTAVASTQLISITWDSNDVSGFKQATDIPYVFINDFQKEISFAVKGDSTRADGSQLIQLPANFLSVGNLVKIFLAFSREDGTIVDSSTYRTATVS